MNVLRAFYALLATVLIAGHSAFAQNCRCASNLCCSQWGFCGLGNAYCGPGCREGPCDPVSSAGVSGIVTDGFFNGIVNRAPASCPGRGFYTRANFLQALRSYPAFGTTGSRDVIRREIAAYFAHATHETGSFCYREENGATGNYCDPRFPCPAGKRYIGRGPLQLTWNYNYQAAGRSLNFDGINNPELLASDPVLSFRASLWFWMTNVHNAVTSGQGFGATIRAINSIECGGRSPATVEARVRYYRELCGQLGVDPGPNLTC